jgi:hypothetical protein
MSTLVLRKTISRMIVNSIAVGAIALSLTSCGGGGGHHASVDPTPPADKYPGISTPGIIGPIASEPFTSETKDYTFFATDVALASRGYVEEEFYIEGKANVYDAPQPVYTALPPTGNASIVQSDVPYKTRFVVRRPTDPVKFNGTVVVEWFNVSDNFDGEYYWVQAKDYLLRAGYAYIGVSAQDVGITNTNALGGLKKFSPTRYGSLDVTSNNTLTGDPLSYDIFSQTAKAAYVVPVVMGGLQVKHMIGIGMSQSGNRLGVYTNYIHMREPIFDGFITQVSNPRIRDDFNTPIIKVLSESEGDNREELTRDQPDLALRHTWWVAGTNHGDTFQRLGRTGVRLRDIGPALTTNDNCISTVTQLPTPSRTRTPYRHVINAALHHLVKQIETGAVPPSSPRFGAVDATGGELNIARDAYGNALGGIRLAHSAVPTARANGVECGNIGAWAPFDTATLNTLYPTHADYVAKVKAAVNASIAAGFVLPEDGAETIAEAEASVIGQGLECSPERCLSIRHFTADYSTTGLLRDHTVYYNIVDGEDILRVVDAAHFYAANGDTLLGTNPAYAAQYYYSYAVSNLRQYIALISQAQVDGRVTTTAADLLVAEANNVIRAIEAQM